MINEKNILTRIRAADSEPPATAYAEEIPSNQYVVGNFNSQYKYTQTKEEDNGNGNMGTATSGEMDKTASNKYLDKIAAFGPVKKWTKNLVKNVKDAEPLTQVGMLAGVAMGIDKLRNRHGDGMPERSLRTLQSINRKLDHVSINPREEI